jgi:hypothetical protein
MPLSWHVRLQVVTSATQAQRGFGLPGALLVIAGGVLLIVAIGFLDWYATPAAADSAPRITFGELHDSADQLSGAGAASAYFDWLAWVLVIALVGVGVAANLPIAPADPLRVVGFLVGLIGLAATYFAVTQLHNAQVAAGGQRHNAFFNSTWGLWLAFAGFALGTAGALLGPRKARP